MSGKEKYWRPKPAHLNSRINTVSVPVTPRKSNDDMERFGMR